VVPERRLLAHALRPDGGSAPELARPARRVRHPDHQLPQPLRVLRREPVVPRGRRRQGDQGQGPRAARARDRARARARHPRRA
jgi:hypothetical protein